MFSTGDLSVAATSTVRDFFSELLSSSVPAGDTPAHEVIVSNYGAGTLRVGELNSINTAVGHKVGPGDEYRLRVPEGGRLGFVGDGGNAASDTVASVVGT